MRRFLAVVAVVTSVAVAAPASAAEGPLGGPLLGGTALVAPPGARPLPAVRASSFVVADLGTGAVLAAKNPHGRFPPASTLKMLTALTLIPRLPATRSYVVRDSDVRVDGSRVGLVPGLRVRVGELFTALLVVSGNDAALALASAAGGTQRSVALLNRQAARLQARDTVAKTVHGLDARGQTSSAYDLALIARAGMALPDFRRYVATVQARFPARRGKSFQIYTHNRLLPSYPGAIGIKNGYTRAARASFVTAATRSGHTVLVTLMHAPPRTCRRVYAEPVPRRRRPGRGWGVRRAAGPSRSARRPPSAAARRADRPGEPVHRRRTPSRAALPRRATSAAERA
jgi:D-alanyl-D-alanine carboxypeptidase (penicillin-binding protein 5/6)